MLDLKIDIDDVPLGLSLQSHTPFKFASNRVWMKPIADVALTPCNLGKVIDSAVSAVLRITLLLLRRDYSS